MKTTVEIFKDIVTTLNAIVYVDKITSLGSDAYRIDTKCTWWLTKLSEISISGNIYTVTDFVFNTSITVKPIGHSIAPNATQITVPNPIFLHGTIKMAQNEVDAVNDKDTIYPMVYLKEIIRDIKNTDDESMIDRDSEVRLFLLMQVDDDWLTEDHYIYAIKPLSNMVKKIINNIKRNYLFTDEIIYNEINLLNISLDGEQNQSLFDMDLSGIELRISAQIRKDLSCTNKCSCV